MIFFLFIDNYLGLNFVFRTLNINYIVKDSYFDKPNLIKRKITNYNLCKNNNQNCTTDDKLKIKKYFNNYILILEND